jgi:hypothetical protein
MRTKFRYAGMMTILPPVDGGQETYLAYTDHQTEIILLQRFVDQEQLLLVEI